LAPIITENDPENDPCESLRRKPGQILTLAEKRMALHVLFMILKETTDNPFELASRYTGVSVTTLRTLHQEFQATGNIKEVQDQRRGRYERQVHWSRHWISSIREIALRLNAEGMPVTVKRIQEELNLSEFHLRISDTTIRKILEEIGFKYRDTGKAQNFVETSEIVEWRDRYLEKRINIRSSVERGDIYEVWLDESYCNQHHVAKRSWFREGDVVKRGNKGRRWVILHAGGREGWCGVPCVFQARSSSKDYHDNMNGRIFEEYFRDLCECLLNRGDKYQEVSLFLCSSDQIRDFGKVQFN